MRYFGVAKRALALGLFVFFSGAATAQPAVSDPSFETAIQGAFQYRPSDNGVAFSYNSGIARNGSDFGFSSAPAGQQVALLQSTPNTEAPAITQSVSGLVPGTVYAVRFFAAARPGYGGGNTVTVAVGGVPLLTFRPGSTSFTQLTTQTFTASAATASLSFTGIKATSDMTTGIDLVEVVPVPTVADAAFETPSVAAGSFQVDPTVAGVTFQNRAGIAGSGAMSFGLPQGGTQSGFLENPTGPGGAPATISQVVTGLTPGATYAIRFVAAGSNSATLTVQVGNVTLGSYTPNGLWQPIVTDTFYLPRPGSGTVVITFANTSPPSDHNTLGIDQVEVLPLLPAAAVDASFETPELGNGFAYQPRVAGMTFGPGAGVAANGSAWGFRDAPDGHQVAFLQGPAMIVQSAATPLQAGTTRYQLQFYIAQRPGYGLNPISVAINGMPLGVFTPSSTFFERIVVTPVSVLSGRIVVTFTGSQSAGDTGSAIDMVSIVPVPVTN